MLYKRKPRGWFALETKELCRKLAAEGAVLLKNERQVLPLKPGVKLAVFGRAQTFYYKSGTGSGGLVHIDEEPCVLTSLRRNDELVLDETLVATYEAWVAEHPFDDGGGRWAGEPWYQEEMPLPEEIAEEAASRNDAALIVLARTAGEDHDNADEEGSYRLTAEEERLIATVTAHFERVIVALNVGNLIDTSFVDRYAVSALMYIWQGGMAGADALSDLLSGKESPSGKLTDTAVRRLEDHPLHDCFGNPDKAVYTDDIYVGYRYFESFRKDAVQFPFGFGLTYTTFETASEAEEKDGIITVHTTVKNVGERCGREVVQVYCEAPCGVLGKPSRQLVTFAKTASLAPGESETLTMTFPLEAVASYDDGGVTGHRSCFVLEAGDYTVCVGTDVRVAQPILTHTLDALNVVSACEEAMAPVESFARMHATENGLTTSQTPTATAALEERIAARRPADIPFTGNVGYTLKDVQDGRCTLEAFVAQIADADLAALCCGEGMNSPKATPGTGGALGGQTERLSALGIPVCCVTDGPSGIRLDSGEKATSLPNGTLLASTWDPAQVEALYARVSEELKTYHVDALLGPGINLHRYPLCGRNFEYFSEDPLLTGRMAAAVTRGVAACGAYATIKHFCCNNQETNRYGCESVVSERALRELYLKPFEIAVKEGENVLIMTAYNPVNGYWTASNYDLIATILRREWGFDGLVMTDWWAKCNTSCHSEGNGGLLQAMVRATGDVYMVCEDADVKAQGILQGLADGYITRGELQACVMRVLRFILTTDTFAEFVKNGCVPKYPVVRDDSAMSLVKEIEAPTPDTAYPVALRKGTVALELTVRSDTDVLAQTPITVTCGCVPVTFSVCGTEGEYITVKRFLNLENEGDTTVSVSHIDVATVGNLRIKQ